MSCPCASHVLDFEGTEHVAVVAVAVAMAASAAVVVAFAYDCGLYIMV